MSDLLRSFRHELHAHPELAHREHATAERVVTFMQQFNPTEIVTGIGGTGVVVTFDSGVKGPKMLFRCELDALPITEVDVDGYASTTAGVSHKCGHDGHMAMSAGLGEALAERPLTRGVVHLLFQPAEETGTGAAAVLNDEAFSRFTPDFAVAIHNMPGFPMHSMVIKPGPITAAVRSFVVRFAGRVAHASEPEKGENPSLAVADLLREADALVIADQTDSNFRLVTPIHVSVGSIAYGVAAGVGEVHFTIRAATNRGLADLQAEITGIAEQVAVRDGLAVDIEVVEDFFANVNDPGVTERVRLAAEHCGHHIITPEVGMRAGEDFGLFTERFPCCLVLLGAGEEHLPIHNAGYDFPDELITTGVELFEQIVRQAEAEM
ncbi:MAG: amidohydrolase [Actinobacteria bacterium]|jgi:amidohydrolase|nr:amidohydrolase [Ilumatobacteraceae bacterium]MDA0300689.1 amidohydrolase [Actinomycetota bacterium]MDA2961884.1 amidohydrolase [Actinomycetota bacterium]MDA2995687.1 amidohydrolase [Actinomycetota bacterium]